MRKAMIIPTWVMVLASIVFVIVGLVFIVMMVNQVRYGECWGRLEPSIQNAFIAAENFGSTKKDIKLGPCVGSLSFVNSPDAQQIRENSGGKISCPDTKSVVIAVPYIEEVEWGYNPLNWPSRAKDKISSWLEEKRGIKPFCKGIDKSLAKSGSDACQSDSSDSSLCYIEGPRSGSDKYLCLDIEKTGGIYKLGFGDGTCLV